MNKLGDPENARFQAPQEQRFIRPAYELNIADHTRQISLWDNIALENGYRSLTALEFGKALQFFDEARKSGTYHTDTLNKLTESTHYWHDRLKTFQGRKHRLNPCIVYWPITVIILLALIRPF